MPSRKTTRGAQRTELRGDCDVLICGASFAGLTVARELAGARFGKRPVRVLLLDRYEIGERQTSACAAPTEWLTALGLESSIRQTFADLVVHTPLLTTRYELPWTFSTFDYRTLCSFLEDQAEVEFETATIKGRSDAGDADDGAAISVRTDRGELRAPLVVDALGWRRVLDSNGYQPPDAPLSRGLEVHPSGSGKDLEIWIERSIVPAGYGWSFPADDEVRVGVGSFDPGYHVKQPTVQLSDRLSRDAVRYQGNWIPHILRDAAGGGVFFVGDSAGHCLPLTAEGIRTAFYFGIACGRELRRVIEGRATRETALRRYGSFSARHAWQFRWMLRAQRSVPRVPPSLLSAAVRAVGNKHLTRWSFDHYLKIAHPSFARRLEATHSETLEVSHSKRKVSNEHPGQDHGPREEGGGRRRGRRLAQARGT
jgi:flavin-dependent dehydrogenase